MNKDELNKNLKQAQDSEIKSDFFSASHYLKEALKVARNLGDSSLIKLCKNKIVEMNRKSMDVFQELKIEQQIPIEEIHKVIDPILEGDLETILNKIGADPLLFPKMNHVEESARKSMPISFQIANLSVISPEGHLVKGGDNSNYSWIMEIYGIHQGFIIEMYLKRIFESLVERGFNEKNLAAYLESKKIFPKNNLDIISTGINRYFANDYISALHILIPQFENVFLSISEKLGVDIVALNSGKDISTRLKILSAEYLNSEIFQIKWHRDFCEQIKFVLFDPLGYMLRHKVAHGQITTKECTLQMTNLILYFFLVLASRINIKSL